MQLKDKYNRALWVVFGVLLIAVCCVALYKARPILFPEIAFEVPLNPSCDLHVGQCITRLDQGGEIRFSITPKEIPLVKPLKLQVEIEGIEVDSIEVNFVGVDMNMGFNRFMLQKEIDNKFSGEGMLPVCVRDSMEWEAQVFLKTDQGLVSVPYRFTTVRPGI